MTWACSGIILAGGHSRRMGQDKAELALGAETLLERTTRALREVADDVLVVGRPEGLPDLMPDAGPLGGLLTGLTHAKHPYAVTVACDHPLLKPAVLRYLADLAPGYQAVVPRDDHPHVLHAVYARSILPVVRDQMARGQLSMKSLLARIEVRWVEAEALRPLDPQLLSLRGANTPEEWEEIRGLVRIMRGDLNAGRHTP